MSQTHSRRSHNSRKHCNHYFLRAQRLSSIQVKQRFGELVTMLKILLHTPRVCYYCCYLNFLFDLHRINFTWYFLKMQKLFPTIISVTIYPETIFTVYHYCLLLIIASLSQWLNKIKICNKLRENYPPLALLKKKKKSINPFPVSSKNC